MYTPSIVAFAATNLSKLFSTRTFRLSDFWSIERDRNSSPRESCSVVSLECTSRRKAAGEKVLEETRYRLPIDVLEPELRVKF